MDPLSIPLRFFTPVCQWSTTESTEVALGVRGVSRRKDSADGVVGFVRVEGVSRASNLG